MTAADTPHSREAEIAYEAIAPVYDEFTSNHNYELWLRNLLPILEIHGLRTGQLLDVACGTGKSFIPMIERGWTVTACDLSRSMVEIAHRKIGSAAKLHVADMRHLPVFGSFELVWSVDDAVNYLQSGAELEQALAGMRRNLAPSGILMFDLNTIQAFRTFFAETVVVEGSGRRLIWQGLAEPDAAPGSVAEAIFRGEPLPNSDAAAITAERHRERHFPEVEVLTALHAAGLECLGVYGYRDDAVMQQPLDEEVHTKAAYVARGAR